MCGATPFGDAQVWRHSVRLSVAPATSLESIHRRAIHSKDPRGVDDAARARESLIDAFGGQATSVRSMAQVREVIGTMSERDDVGSLRLHKQSMYGGIELPQILRPRRRLQGVHQLWIDCRPAAAVSNAGDMLSDILLNQHWNVGAPLPKRRERNAERSQARAQIRQELTLGHQGAERDITGHDQANVDAHVAIGSHGADFSTLYRVKEFPLNGT